LRRGEHAWLGYGVVGEELVELGNELFELAESEEGAILCPSWASDRVSGLSEQKVACVDDSLAWGRVGSETIDSRLADTVHVTEVCLRERQN
jgi:hypothetical protein